MTRLNKVKTVRITFNTSVTLDSKVKEIQEYLGLRTLTAALEHCINTTYKKEIDNYINTNKNKPAKTLMSSEERAETNVIKYKEREDARRKIMIDNGALICDALNGSLEVDAAGNSMCRWTIYQKDTPHNVSTGEFCKTLADLTEDLIDTQYRGGTKEEIINILANQN